MARPNKVERIVKRHEKLKQAKMPWLKVYQDIGTYVMTRKQDFYGNDHAGQFTSSEIFDGTAGSANHLMASTLIGALFPNGAKTFRIDPPRGLTKEDKESTEVKEYFEAVSEVMAAVMDEPTAGLVTSLEEYMLDQGAFGISGIAVFENDDPEQPVTFIAIDAKKITIEEGKDGFVNTVYIEKKVTIRQLVEEFGLENVSEKSRSSYLKDGGEDKVLLLHAIEPRREGRVPGSFGNRSFPIATIWIEDNLHQLKESGYSDMPAFVTRFWKTMGEIYGRSPAMETMPNILEINAMREARIIATEKLLDPPIAVTHDGAAGGCVIDTSAGAINVRSTSGRIGDNGRWIEPISLVGELQSTDTRIEQLKAIIEGDFFIDRLLDLNNDVRMTLGEANIRNELRGQSLGTIYARQISELFTRLIQRVFNILLAKNLLGVIKDSEDYNEMVSQGIDPIIMPRCIAELGAKGKAPYKITFISPAARIMRAEELLGATRTAQFITENLATFPGMVDVIKEDELARVINELTGSPTKIMRSAQEVAEIREQRAAQQQQAMEMQAMQAQAATARDAGQAAAAASQAGLLG